MGTIIVNGIKIEVPAGAKVDIVNGNVSVNGVMQSEGISGNINVSSEQPFNVSCDRDLTVTGNVNGSAQANGNIICKNINGSAVSEKNIECHNVGGSVNAETVSCKNVGGSVNADTVNKRH